jgi:hypothetical protein
MSKVVNIKVKYIRPEYDNLKIWMKNKNNEYIGRKGVVFIDGERFQKCDSIWCNPYKIDKNNTREDVLHKYEKYIIDKIYKEGLYEKLDILKNKNLGCWCCPEACHGDILLKIINNKIKIE